MIITGSRFKTMCEERIQNWQNIASSVLREKCYRSECRKESRKDVRCYFHCILLVSGLSKRTIFQVNTAINSFLLLLQGEEGEIVVKYLQSVSEELVHLGDLGGNAEVNGAVTNLDDKSTTDVGVDLR